MAILVVENEAAVSRFVCHALERHGYLTIAATDCREALDLAASGSGIDLVLTEVVLPDMSGPDLVMAMAGKAGFAPAIMYMSAYAVPELPPAVPFLEKPFTVDVLISRVKAVLARTTEARESLSSELARGAQLRQQAQALRSASKVAREDAAELRRRSGELRSRDVPSKAASR